MTPADLLQELRHRPFVPFRMHLSDGTVYEVRHPELVMIGMASAIIGTPRPGQPQMYESYEIVDLRHVVRLVPIDAPAQPSQAG